MVALGERSETDFSEEKTTRESTPKHSSKGKKAATVNRSGKFLKRLQWKQKQTPSLKMRQRGKSGIYRNV
jgi:hypothetical protein